MSWTEILYLGAISILGAVVFIGILSLGYSLREKVMKTLEEKAKELRKRGIV